MGVIGSLTDRPDLAFLEIRNDKDVQALVAYARDLEAQVVTWKSRCNIISRENEDAHRRLAKSVCGTCQSSGKVLGRTPLHRLKDCPTCGGRGRL